jgi:hypothetical protein
MPLRRRARQITVEVLGAVAEALFALTERLGIGASRLLLRARDRQDAVVVRELHPEVALAPVRPRYVDSSHPATPAYLGHHANWGRRQTVPAGVMTVHDVDVSMPTGMHRWRGRIFREGLVSPDVLRNPKYLMAFTTMAVMGTAVHLDEGVLLALPWNHNFYHWLVELLPRLALVDQLPELHESPLLVPATAPRFVDESLRLSGYEHRVTRLDDGVYRARTLHIPTPLSDTADVSPLALEWLDTHFPIAAPTGRRIYISRGDAPVRYVAGEADVVDMLEREHGFETVVMSRLPLEEQIRTFREASVIVGAHGAAFAHLAFAPRGAAILELFQDGHFNQCYGRMAELRGLRYGFLVCERQGLGLRVDRAALGRLVDRMVADTDEAAPLGV